MNLHHYFFKEYHPQNYTCFHLVTEVWQELTGQSVSDAFQTMLSGYFHNRHLNRAAVESFRELREPINPCIVIFQRKGREPHAGVWIDDKVFHLTEQGVHHVDLYLVKVLGFEKTRYYLPCVQ